MSLTRGVRFGAYEVLALIGSGGMGEMCRACDTKLDRDVAIKVLPDLFVADAERIARFQREARLLLRSTIRTLRRFMVSRRATARRR